MFLLVEQEHDEQDFSATNGTVYSHTGEEKRIRMLTPYGLVAQTDVKIKLRVRKTGQL